MCPCLGLGQPIEISEQHLAMLPNEHVHQLGWVLAVVIWGIWIGHATYCASFASQVKTVACDTLAEWQRG